MSRKSETKRLRKLLHGSATADNDRECGGCTACCTVMSVTELGKGMYRPCANIGDEGCSVYQERPRSCRLWSCQWRLGEINGERPDRSGVVVSVGFRGGLHYRVFELWEGASADGLVLESMNKLRFPVFVFPLETRGRSGTELHGANEHFIDCPFGHGEPGCRISLPLVSCSSH